MNKVRTRVAPSPTGLVHIGFMHNAIFAHALAKSQGGDFILRIEDTDQKRFVEGATEQLYEMLDAFGLTPDEGPRVGGPYGPYVQSEKLKQGNPYLKAATKLIENGAAYYCFLTKNELAKMKGGLVDKSKRAHAFRSPYRDLTLEDAQTRIKKGEPYVIRLKVPNDEKITITDSILGDVTFNTNEVDDQVLIKSDGYPTYQLAVVVDDHDMKITHVTRAYEWISSTPKQILIYRALGWQPPVFAHSSLVLDPDGGKLSKRKGNVSTRQFLVEGYLPAAMINFLILLGWSAPIQREFGQKEREIFSHQEFIQMYNLKDRQKHNAIFDRDKLLWFNQQYIAKTPVTDLVHEFRAWLNKFGLEAGIDKGLVSLILVDDLLDKKLKLINTRIKLLADIPPMLEFFYRRPQVIDWSDKKLQKLQKKLGNKQENIKRDLAKLITSLPNNTQEWQHQDWEQRMRAIGDAHEVKHGEVFMLLRVAITGSPISPPLFESLQLLGKKEMLTRL